MQKQQKKRITRSEFKREQSPGTPHEKILLGVGEIETYYRGHSGIDPIIIGTHIRDLATDIPLYNLQDLYNEIQGAITLKKAGMEKYVVLYAVAQIEQLVKDDKATPRSIDATHGEGTWAILKTLAQQNKTADKSHQSGFFKSKHSTAQDLISIIEKRDEATLKHTRGGRLD